MRGMPSYVPAVGLVVRRNWGERIGQGFTITRFRQTTDGFFDLEGDYDDGHHSALGAYAERFTPVEAVASVTPSTPTPCVRPFMVGQEVIISDRVRDVTGNDAYDCEMLVPWVGTAATIVTPEDRCGRDRDRVQISWMGGQHSWWINPIYLDAKDTKPPALDFRTAWGYVYGGAQLSSMMPLVWQKIGAPVESLSRERGDWNTLIVNRAVLRLRRLHPDNMEELLVKGKDFYMTRLVNCMWLAVMDGGQR